MSVGRRKTKPSASRKLKRDALTDDTAQESTIPDEDDMRIDEDGVYEQVDPNEPRYCICGDVSFGTMISCDDDNVSQHSPSRALLSITLHNTILTDVFLFRSSFLIFSV